MKCKHCDDGASWRLVYLPTNVVAMFLCDNCSRTIRDQMLSGGPYVLIPFGAVCIVREWVS
jgi:hypothetical protein